MDLRLPAASLGAAYLFSASSALADPIAVECPRTGPFSFHLGVVAFVIEPESALVRDYLREWPAMQDGPITKWVIISSRASGIAPTIYSHDPSSDTVTVEQYSFPRRDDRAADWLMRNHQAWERRSREERLQFAEEVVAGVEGVTSRSRASVDCTRFPVDQFQERVRLPSLG